MFPIASSAASSIGHLFCTKLAFTSDTLSQQHNARRLLLGTFRLVQKRPDYRIATSRRIIHKPMSRPLDDMEWQARLQLVEQLPVVIDVWPGGIQASPDHRDRRSRCFESIEGRCSLVDVTQKKTRPARILLLNK